MLGLPVFLLIIELAISIYAHEGSPFKTSLKTTNYNEDNHASQKQSQQNTIEPFLPLEVMVEVNGFIIPAMIDTGAQISVMSQACADRCLLSNQIDTCYGGRAIGVGVSEISGRINNLPLRIGPISFHNPIAILKNSRVDFIIGLDFLRKHNCELNIQDNSLLIQVQHRHYRVPFVHDFYDEFSSDATKESHQDTKESSQDSLESNEHSSSRHTSSVLESTEEHWSDYEDPNAEFVSMEGV
jgi:hypothetical protein